MKAKYYLKKAIFCSLFFIFFCDKGNPYRLIAQAPGLVELWPTMSTSLT